VNDKGRFYSLKNTFRAVASEWNNVRGLLSRVENHTANRRQPPIRSSHRP